VADIVEIAALHGRAHELESIAGTRGLELPAPGRVAVASDRLALCVRPARWLLLAPAASAGATAALWQAACAHVGAAVDLSSGLAAWHLAGPRVREALSRACRLDLDPQVFPAGSAAATIMVQVAVILAALPSGLLLLTPATTARHLREWLISTAKPFGLVPRADVTVAVLSGDNFS
jgi:sarcosine oxidase subunit gamma